MSDRSPTRTELEAAVRRLVGDTSALTNSAATVAKRTGPAVAVLGALVAFVWGRRRGRRRRVDVQIIER